MASIKINSTDVVQACAKYLQTERAWMGRGSSGPDYKKMEERVIKIKQLAKFTETRALSAMEITHDDFALIGEYLTIPKEKE